MSLKLYYKHQQPLPHNHHILSGVKMTPCRIKVLKSIVEARPVIIGKNNSYGQIYIPSIFTVALPPKSTLPLSVLINTLL